MTGKPFPAGMASLGLAALLAVLLLAATPSPGRAAERAASRPWKPSVAGAHRYARTRLGDVSFAIAGRRARLRSFQGARTAPAASVIKAMLLVAYLRQRSVRSRRLHADERALLEPMIRVSDNAAGIQVAALLGDGRVERLARAARMRDFQWVYEPGWLGGLSQISARDQARFMLRYERYVPGRHRHFARHLLGSVVAWQRWGIASVRPRGWRLYFKGGWGIEDDGVGTVSHQVAFLERGRCRLALAILTEHNPSTTYGNETLRGVARRLLHGIRAAPCGRRKAVLPRLSRGLDLGEERGDALDLLTAGAGAQLG
ncbi:MAG TPA: serine hydrolase [Solirubrobacterales bacterium]